MDGGIAGSAVRVVGVNGGAPLPPPPHAVSTDPASSIVERNNRLRMMKLPRSLNCNRVIRTDVVCRYLRISHGDVEAKCAGGRRRCGPRRFLNCSAWARLLRQLAASEATLPARLESRRCLGPQAVMAEPATSIDVTKSCLRMMPPAITGSSNEIDHCGRRSTYRQNRLVALWSRIAAGPGVAHPSLCSEARPLSCER